MTRLGAVVVAALIATACKTTEHATPTTVAAATSATVPLAMPSTRSEPPEVAKDGWFVGTWKGTYQATLYRIDLGSSQGGLPEWKADDPKRATGAGALSIAADSDGPATGTATGALGAETIRGAFDGSAFSARLVPAGGDADGYFGTLIAQRKGDEIVGTLHAGSGDGHHPRTGTFVLSRAP